MTKHLRILLPENPHTVPVSLWSSALELSHTAVCFPALSYEFIFIFKCVIVLNTLYSYF